MIGGVLDLVLASVLGILMAASMAQTPVSQTTRQYETLQQLVPALQGAVRSAEATANVTSGTPGVQDNDGATIAVSGDSASTTFQIYAGRPLASTNLPTPHLTQFHEALTVNGSSPPYGIFIAPSGAVTVESGWTPGSSMASASSCTSVSFTAGNATVTLDCMTGAVSGPF